MPLVSKILTSSGHSVVYMYIYIYLMYHILEDPRTPKD